MSENIKVKDIIETSLAVSSDKAKKLSEVLTTKINKKEDVVLDFSEIRTVPTAFLNVGVGRAYGENKDAFKKHVSVNPSTITELQKSKYDLVLENSSAKRSGEYLEKMNEVLLNGNKN